MTLFDRYIPDEELKFHLVRLYRFSVFRGILNFALSLLIEGRLSFYRSPRRFSKPRDGLCRTYTRSVHNKLFNAMFHYRKYRIDIHVVSDATIIHEIAHALECESNLDLKGDFQYLISRDLTNLDGANVMVRQVVERVMIREVARYPVKSHASELFARYFQLFTLTKEVSSTAKFSSKDLLSVFRSTNEWVWRVLYPVLMRKVLPEVSLFDKSQKSIESCTFQWRSNFSSGDKTSWVKKKRSLFDD